MVLTFHHHSVCFFSQQTLRPVPGAAWPPRRRRPRWCSSPHGRHGGTRSPRIRPNSTMAVKRTERLVGGNWKSWWIVVETFRVVSFVWTLSDVCWFMLVFKIEVGWSILIESFFETDVNPTFFLVDIGPPLLHLSIDQVWQLLQNLRQAGQLVTIRSFNLFTAQAVPLTQQLSLKKPAKHPS